jgi:type IV pilus assembly protein PilC
MIELTQAGEKTGTLDNSLKSIAEYLEYKVSDSLALLTALMEPVLLVFVAVVVCAMMVAIIGPIYSIIGQIGQTTH